MKAFRAGVAALLIAVSALCGAGSAMAGDLGDARAQHVVRNWYRLMLELVRHTPTYSPPVASRSFAYVGVTAFEAVAGGSAQLQSLAGQLNGLAPAPQRPAGAHDDAVLLNAALTQVMENLFANTGPTGQRAMTAFGERLSAGAAAGVPDDVVARSRTHGAALARHILDWSEADGGAVVENMGFPAAYELTPGPAHWVPTSRIAQQQTPLLPQWGENRTLVMPDGAACPLPAPPDYSEEPGSAFYDEAREVYDTVNSLTDEQRAVARFWSDDPMLSPTPPGHWLSIALQVLEQSEADLERDVDVLARVGVALSDSFIACWNAKYAFDLVRPVTYIRRVIDPQFEPPLITPPFPEYPSGHSTQSAAAASVLTDLFGADVAFEDATHAEDGLAPRSYASFREAAQEAGISRLYGGIHFRAAVERGLDQGRCVGRYVNALRTRN
ncbi:vanadium-dependent haloperoxidase [Mesorhizobium xinjiangense]|uniref:vanadium-dependent haloperoxidase n=1 Tax=Mesorhizobium xinjiangense TaxID=2678685 RepID=UPI001F33E5BC|nr:vanadium-dependent haloperoxidase [Mesorhizobium xinjiangense]